MKQVAASLIGAIVGHLLSRSWHEWRDGKADFMTGAALVFAVCGVASAVLITVGWP